MKPNEGGMDRLTRIAIGIICLVVAMSTLNALDGNVLGIIVGIVGVIAVLTGVVGFCPAYTILGIRTCKSCGDACGCANNE